MHKTSTATGALRKTFKELGIEIPRHIYSDSRMNKQAVGIKVVGMGELSEDTLARVNKRMFEFGFEFLSMKYNDEGYYRANSGIRLTYRKNPNIGGMKSSTEPRWTALDKPTPSPVVSSSLNSLPVTVNINDLKKALGLRDDQELQISGL